MSKAFVRVPLARLIDKVAEALVKVGVSTEMADLEAKIMVEADLLGVPSHGIRMLPGLLAALADGRASARPEIRLIREFGSTCMLNGDNGPGRYVAWRAMDLAMQRAVKHGVGICLAVHTIHWGRAQAYACQAARQGLVGICMTNAMPSMAGWGSAGKVIGNNPIAIGIPRTEANSPVVLDMAMSQAAVGTVATWLREGRKIPPGWGVDAAGRPTEDPQAILTGAVSPFGGHKGAGLALMIELLTAGLAGEAFGNEIKSGDRSGLDPESCKLFLALEPEAFGGRECLVRRVDDFLSYLHDEVGKTQAFRWPGGRGWQQRDENTRLGVPVHEEIASQLAAAGLILTD